MIVSTTCPPLALHECINFGRAKGSARGCRERPAPESIGNFVLALTLQSSPDLRKLEFAKGGIRRVLLGYLYPAIVEKQAPGI
jgi:hypothetical protein